MNGDPTERPDQHAEHRNRRNRLDCVQRIEHGRAPSRLAGNRHAERQADRHRCGERTDREDEMRACFAPEHVGAGGVFLEDRQFAPDA